MENPPDPRPVYEADQVVTYRDLFGLRNGYIWQYHHTPWYNFQRRWLLRAGIGVCNEILHWLAHGKPAGGVQCRGGH